MITGNLDIAGTTTGSGTIPVNQKTIYVELLTTGTPSVTHSANARWNTAEVSTLVLDDLYTLANELKTDYNLHLQDVTPPGTDQHDVLDNVNNITSADASDWTTLYTLTDELVSKYTLHNADAEVGGASTYHPGINASTHVLSYTSPIANTQTAVIGALNNLKSKYNAHDADATSHNTGSVHQIAASDGAVVWNKSLYVPREDPADTLNNAIIDSVISEFAKVTFFF